MTKSINNIFVVMKTAELDQSGKTKCSCSLYATGTGQWTGTLFDAEIHTTRKAARRVVKGFKNDKTIKVKILEMSQDQYKEMINRKPSPSFLF